MYRYGYNEADSAFNFAGAVPGTALRAAISPGKQKVSVTVTVRWSLAD